MRLSRQIGIPISKSDRQRKFGRMAGCLLPVVVIVIAVIMVGVAVAVI